MGLLKSKLSGLSQWPPPATLWSYRQDNRNHRTASSSSAPSGRWIPNGPETERVLNGERYTHGGASSATLPNSLEGFGTMNTSLHSSCMGGGHTVSSLPSGKGPDFGNNKSSSLFSYRRRNRQKCFRAVHVDSECKTELKGVLDVTPTELVFWYRGEGGQWLVHRWPIASLRKFGFGKEFFTFECGRRCATGEGIFLFKCKKSRQVHERLRSEISRICCPRSSLSSLFPHPCLVTGGVPVASGDGPDYFEGATGVTTNPVSDRETTSHSVDSRRRHSNRSHHHHRSHTRDHNGPRPTISASSGHPSTTNRYTHALFRSGCVGGNGSSSGTGGEPVSTVGATAASTSVATPSGGPQGKNRGTRSRSPPTHIRLPLQCTYNNYQGTSQSSACSSVCTSSSLSRSHGGCYSGTSASGGYPDTTGSSVMTPASHKMYGSHLGGEYLIAAPEPPDRHSYINQPVIPLTSSQVDDNATIYLELDHLAVMRTRDQQQETSSNSLPHDYTNVIVNNRDETIEAACLLASNTMVFNNVTLDDAPCPPGPENSSSFYVNIPSSPLSNGSVFPSQHSTSSVPSQISRSANEGHDTDFNRTDLSRR